MKLLGYTIGVVILVICGITFSVYSSSLPNLAQNPNTDPYPYGTFNDTVTAFQFGMYILAPMYNGAGVHTPHISVGHSCTLAIGQVILFTYSSVTDAFGSINSPMIQIIQPSGCVVNSTGWS